MDRVNSAVGSLRNFVGWISDDELPEEESLLPQFGQGCSLTARQRIDRSSFCLKSFKHENVQSSLVILRPTKFAVTYTVSHWEGFLIGPKKQFNMMFDPVRILSTIIYLFSIFLASSVLFTFKLLTLLAILIEACALLW
ncbi:hypothetical protein SELMODRAFT_403420 [Selaginella moellendorffii]|uniref:Vesicle transport protein n=1 Tax=Selaginella moellendorffii TaxID=88036 RepID=D8QRC8_SELML|nr:hypothetical protein SELMODRAFT_403420 [Selaginella moellendorffii]